MPTYVVIRLVILSIILGGFAYAWNAVDVITLKVVGQPSMSGPIQKNLEQPFFESLKEKTGLPIKVDYRTVDELGFKDNYQLTMLKSGTFDIVSLRFLQNVQEEPSISGVDLLGLNPDYQTAREVVEAYGPIIDENLQQRFDAKLLGLWTFGPQVIFCNKPIYRLSDLKGVRVRVGSSIYDELIKSQGGIPVVIAFDQVLAALSTKMVDCAISSQTSAYSAKWPDHLTHVYPIVTQMGINGIAISLDKWNRFSESQKQQLQSALNAYLDQVWTYSKQLNNQSFDCLQGKGDCSLGVNYKLIYSPVTEDDKRFMQKFALERSYLSWATSCNKLEPNCSLRWKAAIGPILEQENRRP
jgi:TRAP-type C4-dicarboxylate transport system substrate-binding protein